MDKLRSTLEKSVYKKVDARVTSVSKFYKADLVLDTSSSSVSKYPEALTADPKLDVTPDILQESDSVGTDRIIESITIASGDIMTVNVTTFYDDYQKVIDNSTRLTSRLADARSQLDDMIKLGEMEVARYKSLIQAATDRSLSSNARAEAKKQAEEKIEEIRLMQQDVQLYRERINTEIRGKEAVYREEANNDIQNQIREWAQQSSVRLVLDNSSDKNKTLPKVILGNPDLDATDEVLDALNRTYAE